MGVVPPAPGFLQVLRELCDASGALLVFDEVITGFRVARGGAQELYGVTPDLTILGKILGGGLPLAAFGGRADVMAELAPSGPVYQAGTLSGNPLATAAGLSVLRRLARSGRCTSGSRRARRGSRPASRRSARCSASASMLTLFDRPVRDYDDARACDTERYAALFRHLLERGDLRRAVAVRGDVRLPRALPTRTSTQPWRPSLTSSATDLWTSIADEAGAREPAVGGGCARAHPEREPVFSPLCDEAYAIGLETIYEGYLCHYGRPRLFAPADDELALLLGDYLYAHGLVRIAATGSVERGRRARRADLGLLATARGGRERRRRGVARRRRRARAATAGRRRRRARARRAPGAGGALESPRARARVLARGGRRDRRQEGHLGDAASSASCSSP